MFGCWKKNVSSSFRFSLGACANRRQLISFLSLSWQSLTKRLLRTILRARRLFLPEEISGSQVRDLGL
jgi:hypothetical protein